MGGGGYPFNLAFRHEIKLGASPQRILFVDKGEYQSYEDPQIMVPFWEKARHTFADVRGGSRYFRSFLCPKSGDRTKSCRSCTMQYDEGDQRIATRRTKYFPVISLEWWFVTTNKYGDKTYALPTSPAEERRLEAEGATREFGRHGYLALGNGHFSQLMDLADGIGGQCVNCLEPGIKPSKIFPAAYSCEACDAVLEDLETTELSGDALKSFPYRKHRCPVCESVGLPTIINECAKCDEPQPADLFDVVLPLAKRGENTQSTVTVPHGEEITFIDSTDLGSGLGLLFDGAEFNPAIQPLYQAIDFDKMFEVELRDDYQDVRVF